ncbi:MAG: phage tail protein I [Caldilineaceae bacterium]|nr:phage tail protein I [Caldilineaceae bacterium]
MSTVLPVSMSHVADAYKRYAGETVHLLTRVTVTEPVQSFTLTITVPHGLVITNCWAEQDSEVGSLTAEAGQVTVHWRKEAGLRPGRCLDFGVAATIDGDALDWTEEYGGAGAYDTYDRADVVTVLRDAVSLASRATLAYESATQAAQHLDEEIEIMVLAKGNYLQYLPALYEEDGLTGRFLMFFESFWRPIETQIGEIHRYFDPGLTAETLLPWLASWYELVFGMSWSERQKRAVLASIMRLHRQRGAQAGLREYLECFSGGDVEITEHAAGSFRIGRDAQFGSGIAFGTAHPAHTFAVRVTSPRVSHKCEGEISAHERNLRIEALKAQMQQIIEAEKPAHTVCTSLDVV